MTDALALGAKLLALLEESARTTTYKPALLLALIDRVQEYVEHDSIPVRALAERVVELYWPQTLAYPTTGSVLKQSQTSTGRASIVQAILAFRHEHATEARALPPVIRREQEWDRLLTRVEETLAEWPIPRLQRPYEPFLYAFDWGWAEGGGWSVRAYRNTARTIKLYPGVGDALTALGPLLRPFITRWWTDKAAQLNPDVEAARSVLEFEDFLFGRDRSALERVAEGLLDLQNGDCFYCHTALSHNREIDHFIPWSYSGDDGLDNLVAACHRCNNSKRAVLAGPDHLADIIQRNRAWSHDLAALSSERRWPRDPNRTHRIARAAYLHSPGERPVWIMARGGPVFQRLQQHRHELAALLGERA
ncbi:MAG: HNH endonuclease [Solirubrobacteraceae bacterium]